MDSRAFSDSSTSYPRVILIFLFNFIIYLSNFEAYLNDERLQTAVSQIEHGVLHLVDTENTQITILLDCEGLSPLRFPMQIMRSCSSLLQDHFPNRLGCLFVIRLPPVVRVVAQTFIQVNFLLIWIWITFRFFYFFHWNHGSSTLCLLCVEAWLFLLYMNMDRWLFLRFWNPLPDRS